MVSDDPSYEERVAEVAVRALVEGPQHPDARLNAEDHASPTPFERTPRRPRGAAEDRAEAALAQWGEPTPVIASDKLGDGRANWRDLD